MSIKMQITASEEMVQKIDKIAKSMGVSRSSLCLVWIGQGLATYEASLKSLDRVSDDIMSYFKDKYEKGEI